MKCEGTLWFYCSDVPYLYFKFDTLTLFINFTTVSYHKPIGDTVIFDGDDENWLERYKYVLPFCRSWIFHNPDSVLCIVYNCEKYSLRYGQDGHTIMTMELSDEDAKYITTIMDEVFQQGQRDSYGDFKQEPDSIIDLGIGMVLKYKTSVWKYTRTEHPEEMGRFVSGEPMILNSETKVKTVSKSSSFIT
jgi:hypothetical protein